MAGAAFRFAAALSRKFSSPHSRFAGIAGPWNHRSDFAKRRETFSLYSPATPHHSLKIVSPSCQLFIRKLHMQLSELHESQKLKFYDLRAFLVIFRAVYIMAEVTMLTTWHWIIKDTHKRAEKLRRCLIRLGPFYIKLGQALSTRPDILPNAYCQELAKLQDQIPPFQSSIALKLIESELRSPVKKLFSSISEEPVAAASLGQVYKATLMSGELVAVKVQRPGMFARLTLDSYLLYIIGGPLQRYLGARGDILDAVNEMVQHMFDEINYAKEAENAERFAILYGGLARDHGEPTNQYNTSKSSRQKWEAKMKAKFDEASDVVKVPKIYWRFSSKTVLTMEWIDGIKLTDLETLQKKNFDIQKLVDQGVLSSLRQLLEEGFFHADPHPGNLVVTENGVLAYLDFGMMGDFPKADRIGLIRTLVHFVNRDSVGLANDFSSLGFVPKGADLNEIALELRISFGDETSKAQLDFQGIMAQLSNVMYEYNFRLPPQYALVIRALGSLEGTATLLDPDFKVIASAYPFIIGRLLTDPDPDMRKILRELLIRSNGSIRWHRLERLVIAIAEESSISGPSKELDHERLWNEQDDLGKKATRSWGISDPRTIVSATSDLLEYVLSEEGFRVRVLLIQDMSNSFRIFLDEAFKRYFDSGTSQKPCKDVGFAYQPSSGNKDSKAKSCSQETNGRGSNSKSKIVLDKWKNSSVETKDVFSRFLIAVGAFRKAISSSPELWMTMLFRFATRSEAQDFIWRLIRALLRCCYAKGSQGIWLVLSKLLHEVYDNPKPSAVDNQCFGNV